jgi:type III secretory pathway component EscT
MPLPDLCPATGMRPVLDGLGCLLLLLLRLAMSALARMLLAALGPMLLRRGASRVARMLLALLIWALVLAGTFPAPFTRGFHERALSRSSL